MELEKKTKEGRNIKYSGFKKEKKNSRHEQGKIESRVGLQKRRGHEERKK